LQINDENFIPLLKKRNQEALYYAMQSYGGLVKSIIRRHLQEDCEECMDDVFLAIWENISRFDPEKNSFKNWIAAIAKYKSIDYLRKNRLYPEEIREDSALSESAEDTVLKKELARDFQDILSVLPSEDREMFIAVYIEQEKPSAVAARYGIRTSALYNRLSRGKVKLRKGRISP